MATRTASPPPTESPQGPLYDPAVEKMQRLTVENARKILGPVITAADEENLHTVVTRHGAEKAVIVPMDWYRRMREAAGDPMEIQPPVSHQPRPRKVDTNPADEA